MRKEIKKNRRLIIIVALLAVVVIVQQLFPESARGGRTFYATFDGDNLNAYVADGDGTTYTDSTLPTQITPGYGGTGKAIQASRGNTLKYKSANNLDNEKVTYNLQLKNEYALSGTDYGNCRWGPGRLSGIDYDSATQMFYVVDRNNDRIVKTSWDCSTWEVLEGGFSDPRRVKYDSASGYLYVTDNNFIVRTKMDGTGWKTLAGFNDPSGIDYDPASGFLYVTNNGNDRLVKTQIDGTGWATFGTSGAGVNQFNFSDGRGDVDYDPISDYLYVADGENSRIVKTQWGGTGWITLATATKPMAILYDAANTNIYVNHSSNVYGESFLRTKIDGSGQVAATIGGANQFDFYFDTAGGYYYIPRSTSSQASGSTLITHALERAAVDGSNLTISNHGAGSPYGVNRPVSVSYSAGKIYAASNNSNLVQYNPDGTGYKTLGRYGTGSGQFEFSTVGYGGGSYYDSANDYLYIADTGNNRIVRTRPNGSDWTTITGFNSPRAAQFDAGSNYIYVADTAYSRATRIRPDGSGRQWLTVSGDVPSDIFYDSVNDYLYMACGTNHRIVKTKWDGSNRTILEGFGDARGIYYDAASDYIYVADYVDNRIVKTKIDGTGWTSLSGFTNPADVVYDPASDYLYVADSGNNRIVKTKIDGTGWTNYSLDPKRVLWRTDGNEMRLELDLYSQRLQFFMKATSGGPLLQSAPLSWGADEWHKVSVYFNKTTGRVELKIDDVVVDSLDDTTWAADLPSIGEYFYLSSENSNEGNTVNVAPIDDFEVVQDTTDTAAPTNPTTARAYNSAAKTTEFTGGGWGNAASPYFEFSGAEDDSSGVMGYWVYFGTDPTADPITAGVWQNHTGGASAPQNFTSSTTLTSGETYYLRIRARDNDHNQAASIAGLFTYKFDSSVPTTPEYVNVSPVGCATASTFEMSWAAASDTYSGLAGYDYRKGSAGDVTATTNTTTTVEPYQDGDNVFYVRSRDNAGNTSVWQTAVFCSTASAHLIDGPTVSTGPSSMTVSWVSSKETTSFVKVYEGNTYVSESGQNDFATTHSVKVVGLEPEKAYRYQLRWSDSNGNLGESGWYDTSTAALPRVIDLKAETLSPTKALISWQTSYAATATLEYGVGNYDTKEALSDKATNFSKQLENLSAGNAYQLTVNCTTADGDKFSAGATLVTPPLPAVSSLNYEEVKGESTSTYKVTWTTNVPTSSSVKYRPIGGSTEEKSESDLKDKHELTVSQLKDETDYELWVSGRDQYGAEATSDVKRFKTQSDTRPPKISDITSESNVVGAGEEAEIQLIVSWKTDEDSTSLVEYGEGLGNDYPSQSTDTGQLKLTHIIVMPKLTQAKPYHLRACSTDKAGNTACSDNMVRLTEKAPQSIMQILYKTLTNTFGWVNGLKL